MREYETTSSKPLVSVIIPCYKQAHFLTEAVRSIMAQTEGDWECIIANDGSPDNTREVARELMRADRRIRYIEHANAGVSHTRNRGIEAAGGRYIQFLDADDTISAAKLESQLACLRSADGFAVAYCDYYYTNTDGQPIPDHPCYRPPMLESGHELQDLALGWETKLSIPIHCFLFDARIFKGCGIRFDESLPNNEDWDCWMSVLALNPRLIYINEKHAAYRLHDGASTRDMVSMRKGFLKAIRKQQRLFQHNPEMYEILARKAYAVKHLYRDYAPVRRVWLLFTAWPRAFIVSHLSASAKESLKRVFQKQHPSLPK
jgi:glycosyltransferase involved in cell wall biosynthesis